MRILLTVALATTCFAQQPKERVFYFPRPVKHGIYRPPMKPIVHLADLKAQHHGQTNWSELVILDTNSRAQVISAAPGSKVERHLHPDAPEWWVVQEGRIRFEIEQGEGKYRTIEAGKGSYIYAPERHLHSLEVIGDQPAIRFEVTLSESTSVWEKPPANLVGPEMEFIPINLQTGPNPSDVQNPGGEADRIFFNVDELAKKYPAPKNWTESVMRKNRVRGNLICGYAKNNPRPKPGDRGHMHADFAEFWIVMKGRLTWKMEGIENLLEGQEGDIIYAPPKTFHMPEFAGSDLACRLTSSTYPAANHIYDVK